MKLNLFRWNSGRPAYPGTSTCGWGRGQCAALISANNGLYDNPTYNNFGCICECDYLILYPVYILFYWDLFLQ